MTKPKPLIMIVGCPRSGTYLLQSELNKWTNAEFPVETHFIPLFQRYLPLWGDLKKRKNRTRLLTAIYKFLEIWTIRSEQGRDFEKIKAHSLLATKPFFNEIIAQATTYSGIIRQIFSCYASLHGKDVAGDKSAFYAHKSLGEINQVVSETNYIHIIRDGRDVSLSWRKIFTGPLTLIESSRQWNKHVIRKCRWGNKNQSQYYELKYEDFVLNPKEHIRMICEKFQLDFEESANQLANILAEGKMHHKISGSIDSKNVNKWTKEMKTTDQKCFEFFCSEALSLQNYEMKNFEYSLADKIKYYTLFVTATTIDVVAPRHLRRYIKNTLPLLIWLWQSLKLPLRFLK